ncbi:MAG: TRAP transporter small permease [Pseudomonadota bacterium]
MPSDQNPEPRSDAKPRLGLADPNAVTGGLQPMAWLTASLNAIGTVLIILLMVLINVDVIGRNFFRAPVPGVVELTEAAIVIIVFLQVGHTLRVGRFTRSDGLFNTIASRRPRIAASMDAVYSLTGVALFALLTRNAYARLTEAWEQGYFAGVPGAFTVPTWPIELAITVGCAVMVLQFTAIIWLRLQEAAGRDMARTGGAA